MLAPVAVDAEAAPAAEARLGWEHVRGLAIALAALALGARAWVGLQGYFLIDDYLFVIQASTHQVWDPGFLLRPHFGHLMPGGNLLTWVMAHAAPFDVPAYLAVSVLMQALAALLGWRLLRRLFGRTPWLLLPFAVYVFSPLTLPAYLWWAAAVNALPLQIAMALAGTSYLDFREDRRTASLVRTVAWTVVGLAFFEKAVLIPLVLLALGFLQSGERNPVRAVRALLAEGSRLWLSLGAVVAAYLVAYRLLGDLAVRSTPGPDYVRAVVRGGVVEGFLPALVGGPWRWLPFDTPAAAPPSALRWVALGLAVVLVAVSSARWRRARRAWAALAAYVAVEIVLLLLGRSLFPALISQQYRYYADAALLMSVAVGCAVIRPPGAPRSRVAGRAHGLPAAVAAGVALNLYVVSSMVSYASFAELWRANPTREYVTTAIGSLQAHPGRTVLDQPAPTGVVFAFQEDRALSQLFAAVPRAASFSTTPTSLVLLDEQGHLRRGVVAGPGTRPGPETGCGWRVPPGTTTRIPLDLPVYRWYFTAALRYAATAPTRVRIGLDGPMRRVRLDPADSSRYLPVRGGGPVLRVANDGPEPLCVRSAAVGLAVPSAGGPL